MDNVFYIYAYLRIGESNSKIRKEKYRISLIERDK